MEEYGDCMPVIHVCVPSEVSGRSHAAEILEVVTSEGCPFDSAFPCAIPGAGICLTRRYAQSGPPWLQPLRMFTGRAQLYVP